MKKLLLVDGSNIVMRAAFGGDIEPERAVQIATGLIQRAIRQTSASHMIIAMDANVPSWRKLEYPAYKADRTLDTSPWLHLAQEFWTRGGWYCEECGGFEADDVIATISERAPNNTQVVIVSNDSDVLSLSGVGREILKPVNGGIFQLWLASDTCKKYCLRFVNQLESFKSMVGESSDNVPGVPGIGPKRASELLGSHKNLHEIIEAGGMPGAGKYATQVYECREAALLALRLVTLRKDAPIVPIKPNSCLLK